MENRLKLRLSRIFRNIGSSCSTRNLPDVINKAVFSPPINHSFRVIDSHLPLKARPFPSICKPNWSESSNSIENNCILSTIDVMLPKPRVSAKLSLSINGRTSPPASPILPMNPFYEIPDKYSAKQGKKKTLRSNNKVKSKRKTTQINFCRKSEVFSFSSSSLDRNTVHGCCWFSSDDDDEREDETETFFSSKTVSSDSSERRRKNHRPLRKGQRDGRRRARSEMGVIPLKEGKVKNSFAVVKKSNDPYNDFRSSMVEMIIEKHIFAVKDLEQLLQCFLSLNSHRHHRVIIEVFIEILEALFSTLQY